MTAGPGSCDLGLLLYLFSILICHVSLRYLNKSVVIVQLDVHLLTLVWQEIIIWESHKDISGTVFIIGIALLNIIVEYMKKYNNNISAYSSQGFIGH